MPICDTIPCAQQRTINQHPYIPLLWDDLSRFGVLSLPRVYVAEHVLEQRGIPNMQHV